jgi:hypothetical protein
MEGLTAGLAATLTGGLTSLWCLLGLLMVGIYMGVYFLIRTKWGHASTKVAAIPTQPSRDLVASPGQRDTRR